MHARFIYAAATAALFSGSGAAPTLNLNPLDAINKLLDGVLSQSTTEVEELTSAVEALVLELDSVVPTATPTSIEDVVSIVKGVAAATPTALLQNVVELALNGIKPDGLTSIFTAYSSGVNSENNDNNKEPETAIYPSKSQQDANYSIKEEKLRGAIHIPDSFTFGQKPPVVLVPGTGTKGGFAYAGNLAKLLPEEDYADPVWLNIPDWLLADAQLNAEYVAYAINYIAGITSQNVSVIAWSQGNLDTQWALMYWPSTNAVVTDYIAIAPDYHGTILVDALCPALGGLPCSPSVLQQKYTSSFIEHFRSAGGASAFVPTTTVYSATDDIVQPMRGINASAVLKDDRNVGVLNVEMQTACPLLSAGLVGTHESLLYSATLSALIKDALTHDGPASIERIPDFNEACSKIAADGLSVGDVITTTTSLVVAIVAVELYPRKVVEEPSIKSYAL